MSAAIQHRIHRQPVLCSATLWPAYNLTTDAKPLRRTKHVGFSTFPDPTFARHTRYGHETSYNGQTMNRQWSSSPIYIPKSKSFHSPLPLGIKTVNDDTCIDELLKGFHLSKNDQKEIDQEGLPTSVYLKESRIDAAESDNQQVDNPGDITAENVRDPAAVRAIYTTSTQRLYRDIDWSNRVVPSPPPPKTTNETHPDVISYRYELKRYETYPEKWQNLASRPFSWDYVQTRDGHHIPGPVSFCSPSRKIVHIPGYMGHVAGGPGEMDNPTSKYLSANQVRTLQPKDWETARMVIHWSIVFSACVYMRKKTRDCMGKGNIPGYTGCVFYSEHQPACANDPDHLRSTASRSYRRHTEVECNNKSPFKKTSSMSRMVTLTHPFNPFNKVH